MTKRYLRILPLLAGIPAFVLLSGCAPRVYVEQDQDAQFQNYRHFAWVSPASTAVKDPILDSQILENRVKRAVETELTNRGFVETSPDQSPDFMVTYHTASKEKIESSGANFSFGIVDTFPHGFGTVVVPMGSDVQSREEGTLMLDVIDGKSKRLVWRGWVSGWVSQEQYSQDSVNQAVQQILAKLPFQ